MQTITTKNSKETENLGFLVAQEVLNENSFKKASLITLEGELGAGKTTFLKGFARGMGLKKNIQSPTFIIMNKYLLKSKKFKKFFHFDCYRIENEKEMNVLDFENILNDKENLVCIEWASKIKKILPKERCDIIFTVKKEDKRTIKIKKYER
ncbi:tRNA (adenosine(37)-N6)-threonylcarbamoyltransferase complex ATPase subunit type 1 TsaE [bacterium]|nr:tRNA (adenosine(37)-N6)-threonylcarbamoyltransferase complex ATPase subunit type 1 TsaE [bacterium]